MSATHPIPTTAIKTLAEVDVLDRSGPTAEVTTATVVIRGRYAVDLDERLTRADATLTEVLVSVLRTADFAEFGGAPGPQTQEIRLSPEEFAALGGTVPRAIGILYPPIAPDLDDVVDANLDDVNPTREQDPNA